MPASENDTPTVDVFGNETQFPDEEDATSGLPCRNISEECIERTIEQLDLQDETLVPEDIEIIDVDLYAEAMEEEILNPKVRDATPVRRIVQDRQQRKRPRLIYAIEVPTLQEILRRDKQDREDLKKVEKMLNPKTTMKETEFCFTLNTIRDRLRPIGLDPYSIDLDHPTMEVMVTRRFLSTVYGGGFQCVDASIPEEKQILNNHNYPGFYFLSLGLNCHAPEMPGSPGLFFSPENDGEAFPIDDVKKLFTRITSVGKGGKTPLWQYQGEYALKPDQPLTSQEWASVDLSVRRKWVWEIWRLDWGKETRVRIFLRRRHGRKCTRAEFLKLINDKKDYANEVSVHDIAEALLRGEEKVAVWTVKCVGYDIAFQRDLAAKFANWVPPPKQPRKNTKKTKKNNKPARKKQVKKESEDEDTDFEGIAPAKTMKRRVMGKKRKRDSESSEESDEGDDY
ncbi:hypothetical protein H0H92_008363 [Tricholoma furcatifolium]|nr:hypothetical protein H0H92_008363 [Tricholoma furcatifolium]